MTSWTTVLLAATALHLGFQGVVTAMVYPALTEVGLDDWPDAHARHSRRVTPLVVLVYAAALVACIGALLVQRSPGVWLAALGTGTAFVVTATVAAPAHGRLGDRRDVVVLRRLVVADRVRLAGAVVGFVGALVAV